MAKELKDLVVGLDIGTAKVMAVVAEVLFLALLALAAVALSRLERPSAEQTARPSGA